MSLRTESVPRRITSQLFADQTLAIFIDCQANLVLTVSSMAGAVLTENVAHLAGTARELGIPVIMTTLREKTFGGPVLAQLRGAFPEQKPIDCPHMSIWRERRVVAAVRKSACKKLLIAGVWTDFRLGLSVVEALKTGFDVYVAADACGDISAHAHEMAVARMCQAGAVAVSCSEAVRALQSRLAACKEAPAIPAQSTVS
jgi:nicotinamidase-related amidase